MVPKQGSLPRVRRFVRSLRGGSQPILAQATDGQFYVVKFNNSLHGPDLAFHESMGTELYRVCGLPVPDWSPLVVTRAFVDNTSQCWMETPEGIVLPEPGICFGSRFLNSPGSQIFEILPGCAFGRVRNSRQFWTAWLLDICAEHADTRQAIFREETDHSLNAIFIDHGHMFGGPDSRREFRFRATRYLDSRVYPNISVQFLQSLHKLISEVDLDWCWRFAQTLPQSWQSASATARFTRFAERITDSAFVEGVIQQMAAFRECSSDVSLGGVPRGEALPRPEALRSGLLRDRSRRVESGPPVSDGSCLFARP